MKQNINTKVLRISCIVDAPSAIQSLFHLDKYNLLAVGRADNSIEIWNTITWVQLIKIFGTKSNSIRKVFMTKKKESENLFDNLRLFSIGLNGYLIEWSLIKMEPKTYYQSPGSAIWDADLTSDGKHCLLACDDGSPRLIRIKKNDLLLEKQYSKADSKVISVKISNYGDKSYFYCGLSNGNILKYAMNNGQIVLTLNIESSKSKFKDADSVFIWTLAEFNTKYICSGDSKGYFRIWDSQFGVLVKEFKEHEADILASCLSNTSQVVYFTGCDSLICSVQMVNDEFILTSKFRGQSHDIYSVCLQGDLNILSGGLTTDVCIYKLINSRFIDKYDKKVTTTVKRHISAFEQKSKVYHTKLLNDESILVLHRRCDKLQLWRFNEHIIEKSIMIAEIHKKNTSTSTSFIISATISNYGKFIAYSDTNNTVILSFDYENNEIKKIKTLKSFVSKFIFFSEDETQLISIDQTNNKLQIYDIRQETFETIFIPSEIILSSAISEGNYLAFSTLNKNLLLINLAEKTVDSSIPHPDDYVTQLKFLDNENLLMVCENNKFYIVEISKRKFSAWTRNNMNIFPKNYLRWYNKIMGVASMNNNQFVLYTDYNYINIDLNKQVPSCSDIVKDKAEKLRNAEWNKKIKEYHRMLFNQMYKQMNITCNKQVENQIFEKSEDCNAIEGKETNYENDNFKITSRFSSILYMDYIKTSKKSSNDRTLIVIENDWNKILKEFPETVAKFSYGY